MNLLEIFSMFCFTIKNLVPTSIIAIKDAIIFGIISLNALYGLKYKIDFAKSKRKYENIKREY